MSPVLTALVLAGAIDIDGQAALRHAAALAALGPHPWGSPRTRVAAEYVEGQFREAGLNEVRRQSFQSHGIAGSNVIGVLRGPGREFLVLAAHHDSAPDAPGAYDDGGGVGILIETARLMVHQAARPRTLVFISFDGEEAWSTGRTTNAGARAYVASLGSEARHMVAALVIEMSGWSGGRPALHPIAYPDPLRPDGSVVAPGWLVSAALAGARQAGAPLAVGDGLMPWLYQPAVRTLRAGLYGDDRAFLQAGLPAVFVSDSTLTSFYPWYHQPGDTKDKLSAAALERMGRSVVGALQGLQRAPTGPRVQPDWFAAFGRVFPRELLLAVGALSLVPGLLAAFATGGLTLWARLAQVPLFGLLLWRHPVPALCVFLLPNVLSAGRSKAAARLSLLPALGLAGVGVYARQQGLAAGLWLVPWELALAALALALLALRVPQARSRRRRKAKRR